MEAGRVKGGKPGVVVAHSLGNLVFRSFVNWMEKEFEDEEILKLTSNNAGEEGVLEGVANTFYYYAGYDVPPSGSLNVGPAYMKEAKERGKKRTDEWLAVHVGTYVGLSAPLLGAVNPLRAVLSGEPMGLPIPEKDAKGLERSFGSTNTAIAVSSRKAGDWEGRGGRRGLKDAGGEWERHGKSFDTMKKLVDKR